MEDDAKTLIEQVLDGDIDIAECDVNDFDDDAAGKLPTRGSSGRRTSRNPAPPSSSSRAC